MPLTAGTRLGPYEIVCPLGAGGMGQVYRARDPRMGREVAIKVSAGRFSDRFDREVRAVAALNHANICQVYDVGPNYLVLELVEGPTLADRIQQGAVPLEEALALARQIGDALEAAHEKGIVHRDLKPANIKIKPDGTVKVLDFGLAKMSEQAAAAGNPEESPTVAMGGTIAGQILGTAAYMAPEQARGKTVDKRADIWAFGVVLYEMLTNERMFSGETISETLAGVLTKEPDWRRVPVKAQRLLKGCLEKDPKRRLRDIGDAWRLLEDATAIISATGVRWKISAGILAAALVASIWAPWKGVVKMIDQPSPRIDLDLGPDASLAPGIGPAVVLSPDGSRLVFVSEGNSGTHLWVRRLDQPKAVRMPGTEDAYAPFFSPDGQWVGFFTPGKLKKTRADGGDPVILCEAPAGRGASWTEDGTIVAALDPQGGLSLVPAASGNPAPLTSLGSEHFTHRWPSVVAGSQAILFTASRAYVNFDHAAIAVFSLKERRMKTLIEQAGMYPRYLPSGHVAYATNGTLFAVPFDLERLQITGTATPLGEISTNPTVGSAQFDISRNGILAYRTAVSESLRTLQWLESNGKTTPVGLDPALYQFPRVSPDGSRVAVFLNRGTSTDLWVHDWQRGNRIRLTEGMENTYPVWSPDGRFLVFESVDGMYWVRADGSGKQQPLTKSKASQTPNAFKPDGTRLVYSEATADGAEIRTLPIEISSGQLRAGTPETFLKTPTVIAFSTFSPDGNWLAYTSAQGGKYEVYVRAFPDNGMQVQVSNAGGIGPVWSQTASELFYQTLEDQRIMLVKYSIKAGSFSPEKPSLWSANRLAKIGLAWNYDIAPDGKRFLALMPAQSSEQREPQNHVMLVTNFFDEVRRRVAGEK